MRSVSVFRSQPKYLGYIPHDAACYRCGTNRNLHRHHILNGPLRSISEREGLWCYLCADCHEGPFGIHANGRLQGFGLTDAEHLKWHAQSCWEARYVTLNHCTLSAARLAWTRLGKAPIQSYDYVAKDDHANWVMRWTR